MPSLLLTLAAVLASFGLCAAKARLEAPQAETRPSYDPLARSEGFIPEHLDLEFLDEPRERKLPLRIHLPKSKRPEPVLLFSHGLGGSRAGSSFLGQHWSARDYVAIFLQHPGSDEATWKGKSKLKAWGALRKAASKENMLLRIQDVPAVLDQLALWNATQDHSLAGRLDLERIGMSGHSFGAATTQAVSGQTAWRRGLNFLEERIDAALILSPSAALRGDPSQAFGSVSIPWMLMTGTKDSAPVGNQSVASRLQVYPYLPAEVPHYELVLWEAQHSAFSDRLIPGEKHARNPNHHRAILALSTAFFDLHLKADPKAATWLLGDAARDLLEPGDRWQFSPKPPTKQD